MKARDKPPVNGNLQNTACARDKRVKVDGRVDVGTIAVATHGAE